MFNINLNHITAENLAKVTPLPAIFEQAPWKYLDISQFDWDSEHTNLQQRAISTFDKLYGNDGQDISLFDVLALLVIEQDRWQDKQVAHKVCDTLWQSMINSPNQTTCLNSCLLFTSHYVQSPEFYTEILDSKRAMFDSLKTTLQTASQDYTWHDDTLKQISQTIIISNQPKQFAVLAFQRQLAVETLQKYANLHISKIFKTQSQDEWMNNYFALGTKQPKQLPSYKDALIIHLKRKNGVAYAVEQAKMIFDHPYFGGKRDLTKLESKVKPFETIFEWLKEWESDADFIELLDGDYRTVLRCWLGSGNYYQLENVIDMIARENDLNYHTNSITMNRFLFWSNYQIHFIDNWLLIPDKDWHKYPKAHGLSNVKNMHGGDYPIALLKVKGYYFIQTFVATALGGGADLLATTELLKIDNELRQPHYFDYQVIKTIKLAIIHDHMMLWQNDMALCLESINILMANPKNFVITPTVVRSFPQKIKAEEPEERKTAIKRWYNNRKFTNEYGVDLKRCALSYQRYFG